VVLALVGVASLGVYSTGASGALLFKRDGVIRGPGGGFGDLDAESVAIDDVGGRVLVADSGGGLVYDFESRSDTVADCGRGAAAPQGFIERGWCQWCSG
jgi:hypothetical protein